MHGRNVGENDAYLIEWESVPGRQYNVYWASSLGEGFELVAEGLRYPQNSYSDPSGQSGFYRIEVQLDE
ncbi:MAG: hypothetical protein V3V05_05830 [Pontiella sp.]